MKPILQLRSSQHLALTPQLQQSIRLLQLSSLELNQELEQMLLENPLLERLDDPSDLAIRLAFDGALNTQPDYPVDNTHSTEKRSSEGSASEDNQSGLDPSTFKSDQEEESFIWGAASRSSSHQDDDEGSPQLERVGQSLREYLLGQASLCTRTERDCALLQLLIEALDENGYLDQSLEQIHAELHQELEIEIDDLSFALTLLQSLDPAGVGARSASECLTLQIKRLSHVPCATKTLALTLAGSYLPELGARDFNKIKKAIGCNDQNLREAQEVVRQCHPHPGLGFNTDRVDFVAADVITIKTDAGWAVHLNQDVMPKLQINSLYAKLLKQHKEATSLQTHLQEARWLIKNIHQRYETILRVSQEIVRRQCNFFTHGAVAMRPLILREIAEPLGLHESTISRVTTQKYMMTPHGLFELKYFFGSHISTEAGGEASSTAIRALIKQLIGEENQTTPLSDSRIATILAEQGMVIARRTVAKYREALKIPPVSMRKIL